MASGGEPKATAVPRAPSHAERSRTLAARARTATLSTIARDPAGYPYGSLVTAAADAAGRPLLLLSRLAEHTQNLAERSDASLLLVEPLASGAQALAAGRLTLLGPCRPVPETDRDDAKDSFLSAHADASAYVDFADFAFFRLEPIALRFVGGFGRMSWVTAEDYRAAEPDPLAQAAAGIVAHMNEDHADAVLAYARVLAGVARATSATITAIDRYGFEIAAVTPEEAKTARLAFAAPLSTTDEVRKAMVEMLRAARAASTDGIT